MAIVKRASLAMSGNIWGNWFNGLGCSLISATNNVITIDGTYKITKDNNLVTCYQGSTKLFEMLCNNPCVVTVCCSNTLVYIQCADPQSRRFIFVYEKLTDRTLLGYYGSGNDTGIPFKSITDIIYADVSTGIEYTHGALLNYSTQLGYIDYTNDGIFNNSALSAQDNNFLSCTTVTADKEITFNGANYYSVGVHTVVLIDPST